MSRTAKRITARFLTTILVMMIAAPAMADLPGPGPRPHPPEQFRTRDQLPEPAAKVDSVPIMIRVDLKAEESVLRIPKQFLPAAKLGAIEEQQPAGNGSMRHVIAAIALSGAITGMFFVRRDRKVRAAVVILVCLCAIAAAGRLMANAPAPARFHPDPVPNQRRPEPDQPATSPDQNIVPSPLLNGVDGNVTIQVTDGGTAVTLIMSGKLTKSSGLTTTTNVAAPNVSAPAPSRAPNASNAPSP